MTTDITIPDLDTLIPMVQHSVGSKAAKKDYARELRAFFCWYEQLPWLHGDGFCRSTVMAYRAAMQDADRGPVSLNKALCSIRALARQAADNGMMDAATANRIIDVPQVERRSTKLGRWLTAEEMRLLLTAPSPTTPNRGMRDRAAVCLMGLCGLRREEAAGLVVNQVQERGGRPVLADVLGKGGKVRTVPIHPIAHEAVIGWIRHAAILEADSPVLPTIANPDRVTVLRADGARLYDACKRYCTALDLEFRPHDLRRSFSVLARKGGAELEQIRDALGHASLVTTEIYLRGPMSLETAAVDRIAL